MSRTLYMALCLALNAPLAMADTTSWSIRSVEWLVDMSDAIVVATVVTPGNERRGDGAWEHEVEVTDVILDHEGAPRGRVRVKKTTHVSESDVLVLFYHRDTTPLRFLDWINTSRGTELIRWKEGLRRGGYEEYRFIAMDCSGGVIESREQLLERIQERLKKRAARFPWEHIERLQKAAVFSHDIHWGGYWRVLPTDLESGGYDVVLDLLCPIDHEPGGELERRAYDYTSPPGEYLSAQAVLRLHDSLQTGAIPTERDLEARALAGVLALHSQIPERPGWIVEHRSAGLYSRGAAGHLYMVSPDGKRLFELAAPGCTIYDLASGEMIHGDRFWDVNVSTETAQFSPDGRFLAWHWGKYGVTAIDTHQGETVFDRKSKEASSLRFSADSRVLGYLDRVEEAEYVLLRWNLVDRRQLTPGTFRSPDAELVLEDLGVSGRFAVFRKRGGVDASCFVADLEDGAVVAQAPGKLVRGRIGPQDQTFALLREVDAPQVNAEARNGLEGEGDDSARLRELLVLRFGDEEPLVRATVPGEYAEVRYLGDAFLAIYTSPVMAGGKALLFSLDDSSRRGECVTWTATRP